MSKDPFCSYGNAREQALVGYLYDDISSDEKVQFNRHLSGCAVCRAELESLAAVRAEMGAWDAPALTGQVAVRVAAVEPLPAPRSRTAWQQRWREIPAWAQAAAAVLVLGASAGVANLEVSYGAQGLSVRTGWNHQNAAAAPAAPTTASVSPTLTASPAPAPSPTPVNVAAAGPAAAPPAVSTFDDEAFLRRVRSLVQESEKRQQRELALRLAEYTRESQVQRQADLMRIDRTLGVYQRNTGMEVLRTQQQLNSLVQRVSEQK